MPKISALPSMTTADAADEAPIVDTSASSTKKWTLTLLKTYLQSLVGWVTSSMIIGIDKSLTTTDSNPYKFSAYCSTGKGITNTSLIVDLQSFLIPTAILPAADIPPRLLVFIGYMVKQIVDQPAQVLMSMLQYKLEKTDLL